MLSTSVIILTHGLDFASHIKGMLDGGRRPNFKPREDRQNVVLQARIRADGGWGDACILNLSSRGLLAYSQTPASPGTIIELRRGEQVIIAQVVWRQDRRIGLKSRDRLVIDEIISGSRAANLQISVPSMDLRRCRTARSLEESRTKARLGEFLSIITISAALAALGYSAVAEALSTPIARVSEALAGR